MPCWQLFEKQDPAYRQSVLGSAPRVAVEAWLWELCAGRRFLTRDPQKHLEDAAAGRIVVPGIAAEIGAPMALDSVILKLTKNVT